MLLSKDLSTYVTLQAQENPVPDEPYIPRDDESEALRWEALSADEMMREDTR